MNYYYIIGLRIESKKWEGSKFDFINHKTKNKYLDKAEALANLNELITNLNNLLTL